MRAEHAPGDGTRFEQAETKQNGIAHAAPNGPDGIAACGDALHQHSINCHAYKNQQSLKADGEQGLDVVLSSASDLPVGEGGNGDWGQAGDQVYFNHAAIDNDEDDNVDCPHGHMD